MTNLDRWRLFNRDLFSPAQYVDWGWYSLVGMALERRVYLDNEDNALYPNMFVVFVAPAGVGKGLVCDQVAKMMRHHKKYTEKSDVQLSVEVALSGNPDAYDYLFKLAPDSTTFESMVQELQTKRVTQIITRADGRPYLHASLAFILDEYHSIFKEHADDLITFLLTVWGGKDYLRRTKHKGHHWIKNPCVNLLAGTTPTEFAKLLRREILGSGLLARTILIYEERNPKRGIKIPAPDHDQAQARDELLAYLQHLKTLCTCIKYDPDAEAYLSTWYSDPGLVVTNTHPKLEEYFVRKLTHVHKLAMILHFSEPTHGDRITCATLQRAIAVLEHAERTMHIPLNAGGRNELHAISNSILSFMKRSANGYTFQDLLLEFVSDVTAEELQTILLSLREQRRVLFVDTGSTVRYTAK